MQFYKKDENTEKAIPLQMTANGVAKVLLFEIEIN
jgi:hypothetical protein